VKLVRSDTRLKQFIHVCAWQMEREYLCIAYIGDSHSAFWKPKPGNQLTQPLGFD